MLIFFLNIPVYSEKTSYCFIVPLLVIPGGFLLFFTLYAEVTLNSELKSGLYMLYEWGKRELARYQHSDQSAQNPQGLMIY